MKHFSRDEFRCPCCQREAMSTPFLEKLDMAREIAGVPFVISSGWRCHEHNRKVGGKENSEHPLGQAADIVADNSHHRFRIVYGLLRAGFTRIGIGKSFIHAGNSVLHPAEVMWDYY